MSLFISKLRLPVLLSTILAALWLALAGEATAHELRPAVSDIEVSAESLTMTVTLSGEAVVTGIDQSALDDTNESPLSDDYDALRALPPEQLAERFTAAWPDIAAGLDLRSGPERLSPDLQSVEVVDEPDPALPRDSRVTFTATLPQGDAPVTVGWQDSYGPLVIRQVGAGEDAYTAYLNPGDRSEPLPRGEVVNESHVSTFLRYIVIGFEHIIPMGLDHILFVLGLFFFSLHLRPLLLQVTAFTLAHTATLALASLGLVTIPATIVEPLIALSITYVAIENILRPKLGWWRYAVVFGFGLLHGLGFAYMLGDLGLSPARFVTGLIGFNVGVEFGQLTVILAALVLVGWAGRKVWYRRVIAVPASIFIALVGAYWFLERTVLAI